MDVKIHLKIAFVFVLLFTSCHDVDFNSEKWKNCKFYGAEGYSLRWDMSEDLIKNYNLIGQDTTEIFDLLGTEKLDCYDKKCTRYVLGGCRTGINTGTLELTFENGRVTKLFKHCN